MMLAKLRSAIVAFNDENGPTRFAIAPRCPVCDVGKLVKFKPKMLDDIILEMGISCFCDYEECSHSYQSYDKRQESSKLQLINNDFGAPKEFLTND